MARLHGDILLNEQVIYADLDIFLHESRRGTGSHWEGHFLMPVGKEPELRQEYTLSLDDGRVRQIIIIGPDRPGGGARQFEFIGTGPISQRSPDS